VDLQTRRLVLLGSVFIASRSAAQQGDASRRLPVDNDEIPFAPLTTPSRFSIGWPRGVMHEGDVAIPVHLWSRTSSIEQLGEQSPNFALRDCFGRSTKRPENGADKPDVTGTGCTLTFLPHFTFRQLKGGSAPVKTPTFNPGLELNVFMLGLDGDRTDRGLLSRSASHILSSFRWLGMGPLEDGRTGTLGAFHLRVAHYSNGQAGCLFANQLYVPSKDACDVVPGADTLNTNDGSFSTHYIEAGATAAPTAFDALGVERRMMSLGYAVRSYPGGWVAGVGGMSRELAEAYGRWEFLGSAMARWRPASSDGRWRTVRTVRFEGACAYRRARQYDKCRGSGEALLTWPSLYGFGVSARYVVGWDPYNIAFGHRAGNPHSGIPILSLVFDHSRAVTITGAARSAEIR
jgi:hypothetical protein